jgi:hypothetical protein
MNPGRIPPPRVIVRGKIEQGPDFRYALGIAYAWF